MADFKVTPLAADLDFDNLASWDVIIIGAGPGGWPPA
jgi:ribulose 1,5-bisphosphate synthetase/thiazole synthase